MIVNMHIYVCKSNYYILFLKRLTTHKYIVIAFKIYVIQPFA